MNDEQRVAPDPDGPTANSRRRWAAQFTRPGDRAVPGYGTDEWARLPTGDPRKIAAVHRAAEAWARELEDWDCQREQAVYDATAVPWAEGLLDRAAVSRVCSDAVRALDRARARKQRRAENERRARQGEDFPGVLRE